MSVTMNKKRIIGCITVIVLIIIAAVSFVVINANSNPKNSATYSTNDVTFKLDRKVDDTVKKKLLDFVIENAYDNAITENDFEKIIVVKVKYDWSDFNKENSTNHKNVYDLFLKEKDKEYGDDWHFVSIDLDTMELLDAFRTPELPDELKDME